MKRYLKFIIILTCLMLLVSVSLFASDKYVSSRYSVEYHRPTCKKALKIDPRIRVTYKTVQEALDAGKQPCKVCNPATKDNFLESIIENF